MLTSMYAVHGPDGRFVSGARSRFSAHRATRRSGRVGSSVDRVHASCLTGRYVLLTPLGQVAARGSERQIDRYLSEHVNDRHRALTIDGWSIEPEVKRSGALNRAGGTSVDVANTIAAQMGGTGRLRAMIGAKDFSGGGNVLTFRWAARARDGSNNIRITLEPSDTYKVEFYSVRGRTVKLKASFDDIYAEDLIPLFERQTGLYLRM